jgi:hypothetical protein
VTLTAIECTPGSEALAAIAKGLAGTGLAIDGFVSGDFVTTVRKLTGSGTYHTDRGAGTVGAKTLNLPTGPVVILNWDVLSEQKAHGLERTAAHEAGHALLYSRGEHANGFQHLAASEASNASVPMPQKSSESSPGSRHWATRPGWPIPLLTCATLWRS